MLRQIHASTGCGASSARTTLLYQRSNVVRLFSADPNGQARMSSRSKAVSTTGPPLDPADDRKDIRVFEQSVNLMFSRIAFDELVLAETDRVI